MTVRLQLVLPGVEAEADGEAAAPAPAPAPAHALICPRASAIAPGHRVQGVGVGKAAVRRGGVADTEAVVRWGARCEEGREGLASKHGRGGGARYAAAQGRAGSGRLQAHLGGGGPPPRRLPQQAHHAPVLAGAEAGAEAGAGAMKRRRPLWRRGWVGTAEGAREAGLQVDCRWGSAAGAGAVRGLLLPNCVQGSRTTARRPKAAEAEGRCAAVLRGSRGRQPRAGQP